MIAMHVANVCYIGSDFFHFRVYNEVMVGCWWVLAAVSLAVCVQGWHLVMKVPQSDLGGADSVYDLWTSNMTLNEDKDNVMAIQPGFPYKTADTENWENKSISLVSAYADFGHRLLHVR